MKKALIAAAFVLAAGILFAGSGRQQQAAPKSRDTLVFTFEGDPGNDINTISTSGRYDLSLERLLYQPLLNYYGPNDITWLLAESADISADHQVVTYHLRKGVVWSDGTPFTAEDVIFTFEHIIKAPYANGQDNFVFDGKPVRFVKKDDFTLELHYPVFVPNPLEAVSVEHFIMPKHIYQGDPTLDNNPKNQNPVGTGPYKIAEYRAGQYVRLAANERYWRGTPKIPNLVIQFISDLNSAKLALQKGEIHGLPISVSDAESLKKSNIQIFPYPEDRVAYLVFNLNSSRVQDINLRKAVFFGLNRNEMNVGAYISNDYYVNAYSIFPYSNPFYTDTVEKYEQDTAKSRDYLSKVQSVPSLRLGYLANNTAQETQAMVAQQNLKAIGITLELNALDSALLTVKMREGSPDYDIYLGGYIMGIDPGNYGTLFTTESPVNYGRFKDPILDGKWVAGSVEADQTKRREIYHDIQRYIADQAVWFPIVTNKRILAFTPDVDGIAEARLIPIYNFEDMSKLFFK
ncbi:MAG: ABC transporter substrate-binding protein [Treponema sp.]|jgi:peptide/nickel transport system substrate-binding protein|nr:ABC transporter substrate-binding protein [Treponema sp.]